MQTVSLDDEDRVVVAVLAARVSDGTRCRPGSLDMCIDGRCQVSGVFGRCWLFSVVEKFSLYYLIGSNDKKTKKPKRPINLKTKKTKRQKIQKIQKIKRPKDENFKNTKRPKVQNTNRPKGLVDQKHHRFEFSCINNRH